MIMSIYWTVSGGRQVFFTVRGVGAIFMSQIVVGTITSHHRHTANKLAGREADERAGEFVRQSFEDRAAGRRNRRRSSSSIFVHRALTCWAFATNFSLYTIQQPLATCPRRHRYLPLFSLVSEVTVTRSGKVKSGLKILCTTVAPANIEIVPAKKTVMYLPNNPIVLYPRHNSKYDGRTCYFHKSGHNNVQKFSPICLLLTTTFPPTN